MFFIASAREYVQSAERTLIYTICRTASPAASAYLAPKRCDRTTLGYVSVVVATRPYQNIACHH